MILLDPNFVVDLDEKLHYRAIDPVMNMSYRNITHSSPLAIAQIKMNQLSDLVQPELNEVLFRTDFNLLPIYIAQYSTNHECTNKICIAVDPKNAHSPYCHKWSLYSNHEGAFH